MSVDAKMIHDKCMSIIRKWGAGNTRQAEAMYALSPLIELLDGHGEMIDKEPVVALLQEASKRYVDDAQIEVAHVLLDLRDKVKEM
jgi:hypothetical protein